MTPPRLDRIAWRSRWPAGPPPVRIVHLGLGAFHRSHQAALTQLADPAGEWGIAAFTGRSRRAADELAEQGGLFTLLVRSAGGDSATVIENLVEVHDGADLERLRTLVSAPSTALVTLTLTEAGYRLAPHGGADLDDPTVRADLEDLRAMWSRIENATPRTPLARLLLGLEARRRGGGGPIAIVPCDNLPANGPATRRAVLDLARRVDAASAEWIESSVSFVSTSVDRITPRFDPRDLLTAAEASGWDDRHPVVTEPFADWVLSGEFPAGRPRWELAGARFVADIEPFEQRKLRMLNGAHTLLAAAGRLLGHETVASATADPRCSAWLEAYWDETERHLPGASLDLPRYRAQLRERFLNPRIEHRLAQIAEDAETKIRLRILPTLLAERARGRPGEASARAVAAWLLSNADAAGGPLVERVRALDPELASDGVLLDAVDEQIIALRRMLDRPERTASGPPRPATGGTAPASTPRPLSSSSTTPEAPRRRTSPGIPSPKESS